jgi:hypothetical protein
MLGLSWDDPSEVRRLIRETGNLTAAPFGMNLKLDEDQHNRLEAGLEEGVRVVSLFWGRLAADDDYVRMAHQAGALVTLTVGSALEARLAVDAGVDVVVTQGSRQVATSGGRCRRCRSCQPSWTPSLQCPSWPPGGSETVGAWPRCWRWGPRPDG